MVRTLCRELDILWPSSIPIYPIWVSDRFPRFLRYFPQMGIIAILSARPGAWGWVPACHRRRFRPWCRLSQQKNAPDTSRHHRQKQWQKHQAFVTAARVQVQLGRSQFFLQSAEIRRRERLTQLTQDLDVKSDHLITSFACLLWSSCDSLEVLARVCRCIWVIHSEAWPETSSAESDFVTSSLLTLRSKVARTTVG